LFPLLHVLFFLLSSRLPGAQAQNAIRSLEDLEGLGHLTTLHLRDNQLETLDGFCSSMKCLQYLNLRWVLPALWWAQRPLHWAVVPFRSSGFSGFFGSWRPDGDGL